MLRIFFSLGLAVLISAWLLWPKAEHLSAFPETRPTTSEGPIPEAGWEFPSGPILDRVEAFVTEQGQSQSKPPITQPDIETGVVYGRVFDTDGRQVFSATVLAFDGDRPISSSVLSGNLQQFILELPAGKAYGLMVDPASLDGGYSPQPIGAFNATIAQRSGVQRSNAGFLKSVVEVKAGYEIPHDLEVGLSAQAAGRVLCPQGLPVSKALVRLASLNTERHFQSEDGITDENGLFNIPEVFPGKYRLHITTDPAVVLPELGWANPAPVDMTISPGEKVNFGDISLVNGNKTVVGWVVKQDGMPFPDLPILCFSKEPVAEGMPPHDMSAALTRVTTDSQGRFELRNLEAISVAISLTPDFRPGQAMGKGKPAMWEPNIEIDLRDSPTVHDIGEFVVHESRPCSVSGNLHFSQDWLSTAGNSEKNLRIRVDQVEGEKLPHGIRRNPILRQEVPIDFGTGIYGYLMETPMTAVRLTFELHGYPTITRVLRPQPLDTVKVDIDIPADFERLME